MVGIDAVMAGWVRAPEGFIGEKNDFRTGCVTEQGASEGFERICSREWQWVRWQAVEFWMY